MTQSKGFRVAPATMAFLALSWSAAAQESHEPHRFLQQFVGFNQTDFQALDRGEVVAKVLDTPDKEEVAVFGIVWIDAPMSDFVRWQKDVERFEAGDAVEAIRSSAHLPPSRTSTG